MSFLLLGKGFTGHIRYGAAANHFQYPLFFLKFCISKEKELHSALRRNFYGLLSLRSADYLRKESGSLEENFQAFVKESVGYVPEETWLITMPRIFGYAFNPVSFWLCYRAQKLEAVLCEVNNTFGERHFYWVQRKDGQILDGWETMEKQFHVSPFLPVEGSYKFSFQLNQEHTRIDINYFNLNGELTLSTWLEGSTAPLSENSFSRLLFQYGWLTVFVVGRIHYQALKLWLKGATFFRKPLPPIKETTR